MKEYIKEYVENMEEYYVENMKEYVENMKEYVKNTVWRNISKKKWRNMKKYVYILDLGLPYWRETRLPFRYWGLSQELCPRKIPLPLLEGLEFF